MDSINTIDEGNGNYTFSISGYSKNIHEMNQKLTSLINVKGSIYISGFEFPLYGYIYSANFKEAAEDIAMVEIEFKASLKYLEDFKNEIPIPTNEPVITQEEIETVVDEYMAWDNINEPIKTQEEINKKREQFVKDNFLIKQEQPTVKRSLKRKLSF